MRPLLQLNPETARRMYRGPKYHRSPTKAELAAAKLLPNCLQGQAFTGAAAAQLLAQVQRNAFYED